MTITCTGGVTVQYSVILPASTAQSPVPTTSAFKTCFRPVIWETGGRRGSFCPHAIIWIHLGATCSRTRFALRCVSRRDAVLPHGARMASAVSWAPTSNCTLCIDAPTIGRCAAGLVILPWVTAFTLYRELVSIAARLDPGVRASERLVLSLLTGRTHATLNIVPQTAALRFAFLIHVFSAPGRTI